MDFTVFATVGFTLFAAHRVGDYWVQSDTQAQGKGKPGNSGRLADIRHVLTLTTTKIVLLLVLFAAGLPLTVPGMVAGLGIDAVSHYWADRRSTLQKLAELCGKGRFYRVADGGMNGAHELDQSFHILFLWIAAILIAAV